MVSSTNAAYSLTTANTAAGEYALRVLTFIEVISLPIVLAYQAWPYPLFHKRISREPFAAPVAPTPSGTAPQSGHAASDPGSD